MINIAAAALIAAANLTANGSSAWICAELDKSPTVKTVESIAMEVISEGYSSKAGADLIVNTVSSQCPKYIPVLQAFADKWG